MGIAIRQGVCSQCVYCSKFVKTRGDKRYVCGNFEAKAYKEGPFERPEDHGCLHYFLQRQGSVEGK